MILSNHVLFKDFISLWTKNILILIEINSLQAFACVSYLLLGKKEKRSENGTSI